jgi:hypothetical protein
MAAVPELVLSVATPNPLKRQFVFMEGQRHLLYVDEGAPDDGDPFIYLDPNREEPHVKVRCKTYSYLDPPYMLIGAQSGQSFATVQYIGVGDLSGHGYWRPMDFRVTDTSDGAEYIWRSQWAGGREQEGSWERQAHITLLGEVVGEAQVQTLPELVPGRHAELRLLYSRASTEVNLLLHISAFAFMLTRYYGPMEN